MFKIEEIVNPEDINIENIKINKELNPVVFEDNKMRLNVRKKLLKIAKVFRDFCKIPENIKIEDIILVGSNANYNYSSQSDIDLHLILNFSDFGENTELIAEYFLSKKRIWDDEYDIKIKEFEVECYVQDISESPTSAGVYSILNDKWVVTPIKEMVVIDKKKIQTKVSKIVDIIEKLEKNPSIEKIDNLKDKLKKMRKSGLESGGEYSIENLSYKVLRNNGYLEKLQKIKTDEINREYSLAEQKNKDIEYEITLEELSKTLKKIVDKKVKK